MKINWCRILGHKWVPLVVGFELNGYTFITCYCGRCGIGREEIYRLIREKNAKVCTYSFEYFTSIREGK